MKNTTTTGIGSLIAVLAGAALLTGCATGAPEDLDEEDDDAEATALTGGNIVTQWATIAADAILRPVEESTALRQPAQSTMLMGTVQVAVYDALVAGGTLGAYYPFSYLEGCNGSVDRSAAVATTAYRILRTRVPGRAAYLDTQYTTTMDAIAPGGRKTRGIELGEAVAAHYIALRANDNLDGTFTWTQPTPGPGVFEPVVAAPPVDYKMVFVPPLSFDLAESSYFFPDPPPSIESKEYAHDWAEVRDVGRNTSAIRTEEQKQLALWMGEQAFRWVARNQINLAVAKGLSTGRSARYLALAFTSLADTFQSGMSAKYHYNFWRPFHSIPRADTDNNPGTTADPTWAPLLNVNHPEYPAGHGFFGAGAMVEAARAFFGTDAVTWTLDTVGVAGLTVPARTYTSLSTLSTDIGEARIFAGLHYRFAIEAGKEQGRAITHHVKEHYFLRRW
jgi:hypothetical protein